MRKPMPLAVALLCPFLPYPSFLLPQALGQSVISARSGLVNYFEGVVFLDGQPLARKSGTFARMREGSTLLTESGRAEVLLTPDTYLRIGADSSIRMISSDIDNTQVELLSGSSMLDSARAPAGAFVRIVFKDATIRFLKPGNYRMDADPPQLRVYEGEAEVTRNGTPVTIETSQLMPLDGAPVVKRFTQGSDGLLDLWSEERGSLIASNMLNSQSISDPLLDNGPAVPADLASYIGYMPVVMPPPAGLSPYGYSYLYPNYSGFSPYPSLAIMALAPYRRPSVLYAPRYGYGSVYSGVYSRPGFPSGLGIVSTPRPIFTPRPVVTAPRVGVGVRGVGRR
jgi:FecR protein